MDWTLGIYLQAVQELCKIALVSHNLGMSEFGMLRLHASVSQRLSGLSASELTDFMMGCLGHITRGLGEYS